MSRPIGSEHGWGTVALGTQPILEYGWSAPNGLTAGYLMRVATAATAERSRAHGSALRSGLEVARLAAAAPCVLTVGLDAGTSGIANNLIAFHQALPFAVAAPIDGAKKPIYRIPDRSTHWR
jgi:hypothetical protein